MSLAREEEFLGRLQRNNRVQVPVLIRWKHKLGAGEVLTVYVYNDETGESVRFYARLSKDGRFTIPNIDAGLLDRFGGQIVYRAFHTIDRRMPPDEKREKD